MSSDPFTYLLMRQIRLLPSNPRVGVDLVLGFIPTADGEDRDFARGRGETGGFGEFAELDDEAEEVFGEAGRREHGGVGAEEGIVGAAFVVESVLVETGIVLSVRR